MRLRRHVLWILVYFAKTRAPPGENDKGEYVVLNDARMACIRLASLVYVSTYCVPIAHLRQNKPFPLLYLGHTQITSGQVHTYATRFETNYRPHFCQLHVTILNLGLKMSVKFPSIIRLSAPPLLLILKSDYVTFFLVRP